VITPADQDRGGPFSILVFRGTQTFRNWVTNLDTAPVSWPGQGRVHRGFREALESVWPVLASVLETLVGPVLYAGHSLGGALATLAAAKRPPEVLYTVGSPRVGDGLFASSLAGVPIHRIVNGSDLVSRVPPEGLGFVHLGEHHQLAPANRAEGRSTPEPAATEQSRADWFGSLLGPPPFLSDHGPVYYAARLELELTGRR
jgi:pimeloyl-ACP methyl ester carboxylesterase